MNPLQSMMQGAEFGNGIYQRKQQAKIGSLAAMGDLDGAYKMAQQTGNTGAANDIQGIMAKMDKQQQAQAAQMMQKASGVAIGILESSGGDEAIMAREIARVGPQFGLSPEQIQGGMASPKATLMALAAQNAEFQKTYAANAQDFTLSKDQARYRGGSGESIADQTHTQTQDLGGSVQRLDPITGQIIRTDDKTQTFAEQETARSNQADERNAAYEATTTRLDKQQNPSSGEYGLTPVYGRDAQGNRILIQTNKTGGVRAADLPEGVTLEDDAYRTTATETAKADVKKSYAKTKAGLSLSMFKDKADRISSKIELAKKQSTRGNTGNLQGRVTVSQKAANLNATLDTIKANIGFKELQDMRDSSPTGGALGQVTEREIKFLQSMIASIERTQGEEQLDANLDEIMANIQGSHNRMAAAYERDYSAGLFQDGAGDVMKNPLYKKYGLE